MRHLALLLGCTLTMSGVASAFTSGSSGADGALTILPGDGTPQVVIFDPTALNIDTDGDSVYHFTTITIPANITLRLTSDHCGALPIHWLASGDVIIAGTIDLSATSAPSVPFGQLPPPSIPGPGGFPGGIGETPAGPYTIGFGPGRGTDANNNVGGSYGTMGWPATVGVLYGNGYLLPLVGGSGGIGSIRYPSGPGERSASGGAGGGAILIASDRSITVNGSIVSRGGNPDESSFAGGGSGGAIRLMAPTFAGSGTIDVTNSASSGYFGGQGRIRVEAGTNTFNGNYVGVLRSTALLDSSPTGATDPRPRITILDVNGTPLPGRPRASFAAPDVTLNTSTPVVINGRVNNPPTGAEYRLYLVSQNEFVSFVLPTQTTGTNPVQLRFETPIPPGLSHAFIAAVPAGS